MVDYKLSLVGLSVLIQLHTVDYRLSLVWAFRFLSLLFALHMVDYRFSLVWGFPFFIAFVRVPWSITDFSLVWGSLRLAPTTSLTHYGSYRTAASFDPPTQNTIIIHNSHVHIAFHIIHFEPHRFLPQTSKVHTYTYVHMYISYLVQYCLLEYLVAV